MAYQNPLQGNASLAGTNPFAGSDAGSYGSGSGPSDGGGVAFEPVTGDQNSQTQAFRSLQNILGSRGQQLANSGLATADAGKTVAGNGYTDYKTGLDSVAPALQLLSKLTSGDSTAIDEATQPQQDQITQAFDQVRQMIGGMPRGGGKASASVQAPYEEIKQRAGLREQARNDATSKLGTLGTTLAGLGQAQEGVGLNQENIGLAQQGLGLDSTGKALSNTLLARGQDNANSGIAQASQLLAGIGAII